MSAWKSLSPVLRGALTAAVLVLAGLGLWLWQGGEVPEAEMPPPGAVQMSADRLPAGATPDTAKRAASGQVPAATAAPSGAAASAVEEAQADETRPQPEAAEADAPLPGFDLVRVEPGGSAVIAGNAAPGDSVTLLLDGEPISEATADARGNFVALTTILPGPQPRLLTLLAQGEGGERRSAASVIVAPITAIAEAAPEQREPTVETAFLTESPEGDAATPELRNRPAAAPASAPVRRAAPQAVPSAPAAPGADIASEPAIASAPPAAASTASGDTAAASVPSAPAAAEQLAGAENGPGPALAAAPQLLVATGEGLRVLQPSATAAEVPLRVETIGYRAGAVTISGRGTGGPSDLRIYLDNDPVAVTPLETDGTWTAELNDVTPGTYTLRVDQLARDGKVTERFETPFLRETEATLARNAPVGARPKGLAVSVITVQPGYSLWAIASDRYGDGMEYHKVLEANRSQIRDPDLIYPGQIFDLPE